MLTLLMIFAVIVLGYEAPSTSSFWVPCIFLDALNMFVGAKIAKLFLKRD